MLKYTQGFSCYSLMYLVRCDKLMVANFSEALHRMLDNKYYCVSYLQTTATSIQMSALRSDLI